jgi:hypothetical protein
MFENSDIKLKKLRMAFKGWLLKSNGKGCKV